MKSNKTRKTIGSVWLIFLIIGLAVFVTFALPPTHVRAAAITADDSDGDGIPNDQDSCPNSNLLPT
ncbi:MAG: hypothetical protein H6Q64_1861, partial [Firmicutes bacterium]|nr:hypothetical protein [Bacillota bacterium]